MTEPSLQDRLYEVLSEVGADDALSHHGQKSLLEALERFVVAEVAAEREACTKEAEAFVSQSYFKGPPDADWISDFERQALSIAAAIRKRGNP